MKSLIDYLAGKDADSNLTSRIDAKVKEAIEKSLWKEYMTYKEHLDQELNRGIEIGRILTRFEDGMPIEKIAEKSGITVEAVKKILEEYKMI